LQSQLESCEDFQLEEWIKIIPSSGYSLSK
jgi:hypothetical protein